MTNYQPKKKHIEAIAGILNDNREFSQNHISTVDRVVEMLSDYFASINPDFDPKRFREMVEGEDVWKCECGEKMYRNDSNTLRCAFCGSEKKA